MQIVNRDTNSEKNNLLLAKSALLRSSWEGTNNGQDEDLVLWQHRAAKDRKKRIFSINDI